MLESEMRSRLALVGEDIARYEMRTYESTDDRFVTNLEDLIRPVRYFLGLAKCIAHSGIQDSIKPLERGVSAADVHEVSAYHGEALAFVDTVELISRNSGFMEQISTTENPGHACANSTEPDELAESITNINLQISEMQAQIAALRRQLADREGSDDQTYEKLHPKERQSLQKMVLGMAIEQYGYDPSTRGSAVSQIADDLRAHGVSLDEDTIRKQLKAAAEEFHEKPIPA